MSRISKMSKSEALEYLIKVSKVQEKILNKLAQNVDPKADLKKMINRMYAMYTTALLNPSNAGFAAEILRELDNSARSIGLSIAKPFNENNKNSYINAINSVTNTQKLMESLGKLQTFIKNKSSVLPTDVFKK